MVGAIGHTLSAGPVREARVKANAPATPLVRGADRVEISNLGLADLARAPGAGAEQAINQLAAGDWALGEVAGILGHVQELVGQGGSDYSLDDAAARQVKVDANLASVDRVAGTAAFNGSLLLDGNAVVAAGGSQVALPSVKTTELGSVEAGGARYALADLRTGGALAVKSDSAGAAQVVHAAITEVAGARRQMGTFAEKVRGVEPAAESSGQMAGTMEAIRELMLAVGTGGVGEGNRAGIVQILK